MIPSGNSYTTVKTHTNAPMLMGNQNMINVPVQAFRTTESVTPQPRPDYRTLSIVPDAAVSDLREARIR